MPVPSDASPDSRDAVPFRGRKLRLVIVAGAARVPFWMRDLIAEVRAHSRIKIVGTVVVEPPKDQAFSKNALARLFTRWDERRASSAGVCVDELVIEASLGGLPAASTDSLPDVVWLIGGPANVSTNLQRAPYGVWQFANIDGFRSAVERALTTGAQLIARDVSAEKAIVLGRSEVRTHPTSPAINASRAGESGRRLLIDALERLMANEWTPREFFSRHPALLSEKPAMQPSNGQMVHFALARLLPSALETRFSAHARWRWRVGIAPRHSDDPPHVIRSDAASWIEPLPGRFLADPFLWEKDGQRHVFVEEFIEATQRGHIAVAAWNPETGFGPLLPALVEETHLSYPFLFEHEGRPLMMPERHLGGALWTYESAEFPLRWQKHRMVFDAWPCVDATLLQHDGRWWLFCSRVTGELSEDNLYAFHGSSPFGPWTPHALNPVREGLRGSRMAGGFFESGNGVLVRPSQDGSAAYGGALVLHAVEELTPTVFRERELAVITADDFPAPWNRRVHTFHATKDWVSFDACRCFTQKDA